MSIDLPRGWALARIPELIGPNGVFSDGDWVESEDQDPNGDVRLIQLADVGDGAYISRSNRFLTKSKARELNCTFLRTDDVLVARMPDPLGRACIFPGDRKESVTVVDVCVIRGEQEDIDNRWLMHFINSPAMRTEIHALQSGSTRKRISRGNLSTIPLPVPPRAEQTRIVGKLEELLSDLDAGVDELKAAQRKLVQYRQSLLKAAVEGALTADWRAAHGQPQETGAELLQRILTERRTRWEQKQLARFAGQGKIPPMGWQAKYPEPVAPDTADLPTLPAGWVWATLSQVGWLDRGRSKHRPRNAPHLYGGAYPFVQTGDIRDSDTFVREVSATYSEAGLAQSRLWPANTLCITIAANIGKTALLSVPACFPDSVVGFLSASDEVSVEYIEYFMRSAQQKLEDEAPATAQKNINLEILERLPVPVPPHLEQLMLTERLLAMLSAASGQNGSINYALKQAAAQRKNLLKAAFAGQLVPQDPNDEPASALLVRIRAAREADGANTTARKRGRKARETA